MLKFLSLVAALFLAACASESSAPAEAAPTVDAGADAGDWPCGVAPPEGGCSCAADCPQKASGCHGFNVCEDGVCGGDPTPEQCAAEADAGQ